MGFDFSMVSHLSHGSEFQPIAPARISQDQDLIHRQATQATTTPPPKVNEYQLTGRSDSGAFQVTF